MHQDFKKKDFALAGLPWMRQSFVTFFFNTEFEDNLLFLPILVEGLIIAPVPKKFSFPISQLPLIVE